MKNKLAFILAFVLLTLSVNACGIASYNGITITGCQSINITNLNGATGANFQEYAYNTPANTLTGNWILYDTATSTPIYGWAQSYNIIVIKLPNGVGAISSYNSIQIEYSLSDFCTSGNGYTGIAPQLTDTWGSCDNGQHIFMQYGGKSWSSFTCTRGTCDSSNGYVNLYSPVSGMVIESTPYSASGSYVIEEAFNFTGSPIDIKAVTGSGCGGNPSGCGYEIGSPSGTIFSFLNDWKEWIIGSGAYTEIASTPYLLQVTDTAGTWTGNLYSGYSTTGTILATLATTTYTNTNYDGSSIGTIGVQGNGGNLMWFAMHKTSPNGTMPLVIYGDLFITTSISTSTTISTSSTSTTSTTTTSTTSTLTSTITTTIFPIYLRNTTSNAALTFPSLAGLPTCSSTLGGACAGDDTISGTQTLTGDLVVYGNVILSAGAVLNSRGHSIILPLAGSTFDGTGASITTPSVANNGAGAIGVGGFGYPDSGGNGGYTIANGGVGGAYSHAGGNGATPSAPTMSSALLQTWYSNGIQNYIAGGGGGGGSGGGGGTGGGGGSGGNFLSSYAGSGAGGGAGGTGAVAGGNGGDGGKGRYGIYIQADTVIAPTIKANGTRGTNGQTSGGYGGGGGGGGGSGGTIVIAYKTSYTPGAYNVSGGRSGAAGGGVAGTATAGGIGGAGQVVSYQYSDAPPLSPTFQYYPLEIYTTDTASGLTYFLYQTHNGVTTTLVSNVASLDYIPPSTQPSGYYTYNVVEDDNGVNASIYANVSTNMTDIASFSCSAPLIQLLPNYCSMTLTNVYPAGTTWKIISDNPLNQHNMIPYTDTATYSNSNLTFMPKVTLTYNQPLVTFTANLINNPALTLVTQDKYKAVGSATTPASPYTRELMNISTFDMQFSTSLSAITTYGFKLQVNNYSIMNTSSFSGNNFKIYVPSGNVNPIVRIINSSFGSTASSHLAVQNNYFDVNVNNTAWQTYDIYLPNNANGTTYSINIQQCITSGAIGDFFVVKMGQGILHQVQSFKIGTSPFPLGLQTQTQYQFVIYTPSGVPIYTGIPGLPSTTTQTVIPLSCQQNIPTQTNPNANANCALNKTTNTIRCSGNDTRNFVQDWKINIVWKKTLTQSQTIQANTILGSSFLFNWAIPNLTRAYGISVCYQLAVNNSQCVPVTYMSVQLIPQSPFDISMAIYGILMFVGVSMMMFYTKTTHLVAGVGAIFFGTIIGIYNFTADAFIGTVVVVIMCIFILMYKKGH